MDLELCGYNYILEKLDIVSTLGEKNLKSLKFLVNLELLEKEYNNQEKLIKILNEESSLYFKLKKRLKEIRDIENIVERAENGFILDDIELFEIKIFSLISQEIYDILQIRFEEIAPRNLEKVIKLLDPDNLNIATFYIYSSYLIELSEVRKEIRANKENEELYEIESKLEDDVRKLLSSKIRDYSLILKSSIKSLGYLDLILAKCRLIEELELVKPEFNTNFKLEGIYNPKILDLLKVKGKKYQKIDIKESSDVTVLTGANMSGKTVILKTIGLIQNMAQRGFYVPAKKASLQLKSSVFISLGDMESVDKGLSSFAGEMLKINEVIKMIKKGENPIVLIDELARTTNPQEGRAILKSMIDFLNENKVLAFITTHYDKIGDNIKRLRVKGVKKDIINLNRLYRQEEIDEMIDYSLIEECLDVVPEEALFIAKLLKVDEEILNKAYGYL